MRRCRTGGLLALAPLGLALGLSALAHAEDLPVPLCILEALPPSSLAPEQNFTIRHGLDRAREPVTVGLPIPDAAGVKGIEDLGLSGAEVGQFRVLARWPSGNVQWVLVDTLASVPAGAESTEVALTRGRGDFGGPDLGRDLGDTIAIDTGLATFEVKKHGFNLLDRVRVGEVEVVPSGASRGVVLTGLDDQDYLAALDPSAEVVLEENGPVRAVVRARGSHVSAAGGVELDFTVRLHFYRGKSRVRVFYTLRNASKRQVENAQFKSLELQLKSPMTGATYALSGSDAELAGDLAAGESVDLFQGENAFPNVRDYDLDPPKYPTGISGWTVTKNGQAVTSGTREQFIDLFYGRISSPDGVSLMAGSRFAAGWWPAGIGADGDGTIRVGIFPRGNDRPYVTRFTSHTTREIVLDFAKSPAPDAAQNALFETQYPLVAKACHPDWYNSSGALWEKLVSFADEAAFARANGWPDDETLSRRPKFQIYRHWYWGEGGGLNQYDFTKVDLHSFLRQEEVFAGGYYLNAEQRLAYNADFSVEHSDDFDRRRVETEVPALAGPDGPLTFRDLPHAEDLALEKVIFELEHRHAYGMALYYYLSGDERFRETYVDWGEYMQTRSNDNDYVRGLAWNIFNVVDLYRFTKDQAYQALAWKWMSEDALSAGSRTVFGTDWERGFYIDRDQTKGDRVVASFMIGAMVPRAYAYFHDFAAKDREQADRARDALEGVVRFVDNELWYQYSTSPGDYGLPYVQDVDKVPPEDARTVDDWYGGFKEVYPTYFYGYLLTGEPRFLERARLLAEASARDPAGSYWFQDLPDRQSLQHLLQHTETYPKWTPLPVEAHDEGGGSWTLSWTPPAGATDLWIKYSERTIVPSLEFDRMSRTFRYDPAEYVPFFAAENVRGEPTPGAAGKPESMVVSGLVPKKAYTFAARVRTRATGAPDPFPPPSPGPPGSPPAPPEGSKLTVSVAGGCGCSAAKADRTSPGDRVELGVLLALMGAWAGSRRGARLSASRRPQP